ncbi:tRNA epoxyqueuosine(34) reductase QueG [Paenibacillus xylaniclasticus]|uniref:tRNA epoxyqueuosine(34) reductase QueG n=1 Tax=Paenibacillus xylaniclasticus TaxID=588083 RepID=UPI000FD9FE48|nr:MULTISPECIES: tRNA epoxyqueuosine(34) reductase QueG [Paenibacillus]GFN31129.1 epoxyqueuosine reductase [Paenibacillus curdlanolyticus]
MESEAAVQQHVPNEPSSAWPQEVPHRDWHAFKEELKAAAKWLGIDDIGIASADPFVELKERLIRHRELGRESGFEEADLDRRTNPALLFDRPKSIIAIAVAYPSKLANAPKSEPGARRGIFARASWGIDYHTALRERLAKLEAWLRERIPEVRVESMVDTGALSDRAVAERAGLGWSAKNCSIISPKLGSWIYLGEMITNLPLPPDVPVTDNCGSCTKCIDACPTGAIVGPGQLDSNKCVSFLTQTKDMLPDEYMRKIGNRLYGCDTCQIVCPENRGKNWTHHSDLQPDPEVAKPLLLPLLTIGNREFKEQYGSISGAWRGKKPIQRNAVIALGNFRDKAAVPALVDVLLKDTRPVLRGTAAWALGRIGGEEAAAALRLASEQETDAKAAEVITRAMTALSSREDEGTEDVH